jgi:hypothetical protein
VEHVRQHSILSFGNEKDRELTGVVLNKRTIFFVLIIFSSARTSSEIYFMWANIYSRKMFKFYTVTSQNNKLRHITKGMVPMFFVQHKWQLFY